MVAHTTCGTKLSRRHTICFDVKRFVWNVRAFFLSFSLSLSAFFCPLLLFSIQWDLCLVMFYFWWLVHASWNVFVHICMTYGRTVVWMDEWMDGAKLNVFDDSWFHHIVRICNLCFVLGWECMRVCVHAISIISSHFICAHSAKCRSVQISNRLNAVCNILVFIRFDALLCVQSIQRSSDYSFFFFSFLIKIKYNLFLSFKLNCPKSCRRSVTPALHISHTFTACRCAIQLNRASL